MVNKIELNNGILTVDSQDLLTHYYNSNDEIKKTSPSDIKICYESIIRASHHLEPGEHCRVLLCTDPLYHRERFTTSDGDAYFHGPSSLGGLANGSGLSPSVQSLNTPTLGMGNIYGTSPSDSITGIGTLPCAKQQSHFMTIKRVGDAIEWYGDNDEMSPWFTFDWNQYCTALNICQ